jgi:hypothetical protein
MTEFRDICDPGQRHDHWCKFAFPRLAKYPKVEFRANALFSSSLDDSGRFELLGYLFFMTFQFTAKTNNLIRPLVAELYESKADGNQTRCRRRRNVLTIAAHFRHSNTDSLLKPELDEPRDKMRLSELANIKKQATQFEGCYILIATDRIQSLNRVVEFAPTINCTAVYIHRDMTIKNNSKILEHGPWSGPDVLVDLALMSHASIFTGEGRSTLSLVIADMIVANAAIDGALQHPLHWAEHCKYDSHCAHPHFCRREDDILTE